jgi:DNA-binding transcriptional ArsR family regulator
MNKNKVSRATAALSNVDLEGVSEERLRAALVGVVGETPKNVGLLKFADIVRNSKRLAVLLSLDGQNLRTSEIASKILEGSPVVSTTIGRLGRLGLVETVVEQRNSTHNLSASGVEVVRMLKEINSLLTV